MSETEFALSGSDLARLFFEQYRERFVAAAAESKIAKQGFHIASADFDRFLRGHALLGNIADVFSAGSIGRGGTILRRNAARERLNKAALRAENHSRFFIAAPRILRSSEYGVRQPVVHVQCANLYAQEATGRLVHGFDVAARHCARSSKRLCAFVFDTVEVDHIRRERAAAYTSLLQQLMRSIAAVAAQWERDARTG